MPGSFPETEWDRDEPFLWAAARLGWDKEQVRRTPYSHWLKLRLYCDHYDAIRGRAG